MRDGRGGGGGHILVSAHLLLPGAFHELKSGDVCGCHEFQF